MIGRTDPVKPFELIRWAREQVRVHNLKPREAHVLLVLATYANAKAEAWPSLRTIALDCGLSPKKQVATDGRVTYSNSAASAAIRQLEDLKLVWTKQAGSGRPAVRELLYNPAQPSATPEGTDHSSANLPSATEEGTDEAASSPPDPLPSALADTAFRESGTEGPKKGQDNLKGQTTNGQMMPSANAEGIESPQPEGRQEADERARAKAAVEAIGLTPAEAHR